MNFKEIWIEIKQFAYKQMKFKMLSAKWWPLFPWPQYIRRCCLKQLCQFQLSIEKEEFGAVFDIDRWLMFSHKWNSFDANHQWAKLVHYDDIIMGVMASQVTSLTIVYSNVYSGADQRKHWNLASLAFVQGIHQWPWNPPHKWPIMRKMFPFDDIMENIYSDLTYH